MNPAIADLASKYSDRPREDREPANYAVFEDGSYKLYLLTIGRVEWFAAIYEDQTSGNVALPPVCELD